MSGADNKRCTNCKYFFLAYRPKGVCEFCTYPNMRWWYRTINGGVPGYMDLDQIDVAACKNRVFNPFTYFMNLLMLRFLRKEIV